MFVRASCVWAAAATLIFATAFYDDLKREAGVLAHPAAAVGTIVNLNCSNHGQVGYDFMVAGATFSGADSASAPCSRHGIGETVAVVYDLENPQWSYLEPMRSDAARHELNWWQSLFFSAFGGLVVALALERRRFAPAGRNAT